LLVAVVFPGPHSAGLAASFLEFLNAADFFQIAAAPNGPRSVLGRGTGNLFAAVLVARHCSPPGM
jgi:hypothetical protein